MSTEKERELNGQLFATLKKYSTLTPGLLEESFKRYLTNPKLTLESILLNSGEDKERLRAVLQAVWRFEPLGSYAPKSMEIQKSKDYAHGTLLLNTGGTFTALICDLRFKVQLEQANIRVSKYIFVFHDELQSLRQTIGVALGQKSVASSPIVKQDDKEAPSLPTPTLHLGDELALTQGIQESNLGKGIDFTSGSIQRSQSANTPTLNGEDALIGRSFGPYKVLGELGRGGMAIVYKAQDQNSGQEVALKLMNREACENADFRNRFEREVKASMSLQHPNIVAVLGSGEAHNQLYMATEFVPRGDVQQLFRKTGPMPSALVAKIISELLSALAYSHRHGLVHRDIKPANILIGGLGTLKLADFGIAKPSSESNMTQAGALIGTPAYMSPEQARGESLDGRSDLFSVGLMAYELLSGINPILDENPSTTILNVAQGRIPRLERAAPWAAGPLIQTINRLMSNDRDLRYVEADDALRELHPMLKWIDGHYPRMVSTVLHSPMEKSRQMRHEEAKLSFDMGRQILETPSSHDESAFWWLKRAAMLAHDEKRITSFTQDIGHQNDFGWDVIDDNNYLELLESIEEDDDRELDHATLWLRASDIAGSLRAVHARFCALVAHVVEKPNDAMGRHKLSLWLNENEGESEASARHILLPTLEQLVEGQVTWMTSLHSKVPSHGQGATGIASPTQLAHTMLKTRMAMNAPNAAQRPMNTVEVRATRKRSAQEIWYGRLKVVAIVLLIVGLGGFALSTIAAFSRSAKEFKKEDVSSVEVRLEDKKIRLSNRRQKRELATAKKRLKADPRGALGALDMVIRLDRESSEHFEARLLRAKTRALLGQKKKAKQDLDYIIEHMDDDAEFVSQAKELLETLK